MGELVKDYPSGDTEEDKNFLPNPSMKVKLLKACEPLLTILVRDFNCVASLEPRMPPAIPPTDPVYISQLSTLSDLTISNQTGVNTPTTITTNTVVPFVAPTSNIILPDDGNQSDGNQSDDDNSCFGYSVYGSESSTVESNFEEIVTFQTISKRRKAPDQIPIPCDAGPSDSAIDIGDLYPISPPPLIQNPRSSKKQSGHESIATSISGGSQLYKRRVEFSALINDLLLQCAADDNLKGDLSARLHDSGFLNTTPFIDRGSVTSITSIGTEVETPAGEMKMTHLPGTTVVT